MTGLIVIHGIVIGLATPEHVLEEVKLNINVLLLLVFLVSSIHFLKNVLFLLFTQLFLKVENKTVSFEVVCSVAPGHITLYFFARSCQCCFCLCLHSFRRS